LLWYIARKNLPPPDLPPDLPAASGPFGQAVAINQHLTLGAYAGPEIDRQ
jgi:hypothetical protein